VDVHVASSTTTSTIGSIAMVANDTDAGYFAINVAILLVSHSSQYFQPEVHLQVLNLPS
jgi:hypothetical protein